jgi:hypothetical protein
MHNEIRKLADIQLGSMAQMCVLMTHDEANTFIDFIIDGATAFKEGFNSEEKDT